MICLRHAYATPLPCFENTRYTPRIAAAYASSVTPPSAIDAAAYYATPRLISLPFAFDTLPIRRYWLIAILPPLLACLRRCCEAITRSIARHYAQMIYAT